MSKNLVVGMIAGYNVDKISPFVLSFRQHSSDEMLLVTDNISAELEKFLEDNNVYTFIPDEPLTRSTCQIARYEIYLDCITDHFQDVENILIADVRDVIFQSDPFTQYPKHSIEFFAEPEMFSNCKNNAPWLAGIYGHDQLIKIANKFVVCSGTTMGTRSGMIEYLEAMVNEISRLSKAGRTLYGGEDQPMHNYLIYSNTFKDFSINENGIGPISTMHHSKKLTFNRQGYLLNDDGAVIPVVHQYDRCGPMSSIFLKNALGLRGKDIAIAAKYAVENFPEHDLE